MAFFHFSAFFFGFFLQKMTSQQSVNTKIIACFPSASSLFFVIIKRDFLNDYLNVPAYFIILLQNFWFELINH